jgi:hypothetical protein
MATYSLDVHLRGRYHQGDTVQPSHLLLTCGLRFIARTSSGTYGPSQILLAAALNNRVKLTLPPAGFVSLPFPEGGGRADDGTGAGRDDPAAGGGGLEGIVGPAG